MIVSEKIYVSLTSWHKRIENVKSVIETILRQSLQPYKIILNLCTEDFPDMEDNLPKDLLNTIKSNSNIEIYWFIENYKVWKKHLHILDIVNDNDLIICIDDDCLYPEDFIEKLYMSYCFYGKRYPITTETLWLVYNLWPFCGSGTLYWKKCLPKDYKKYLTDDILNNTTDDFLLLILFCMNKVPILPIKYEFPYKEDMLFNETCPTSELSNSDSKKHTEILNKIYAAVENSLKKNYFKTETTDFNPSYWKIFSDFCDYLCSIEYPFPEISFIIDLFKSNWLNPSGIKSKEIKKILHLDIELCK